MLRKRIKSDSGLMGPTHALSAVALTMLLAWIASDFMFITILGSNDLIVFMSAVIIIIGAALAPDLDAVQSTFINVLGAIGIMLSKTMRGFSSLVQNLIKGPYDKGSDPHRGFWHTFLSAFIAGMVITSLTSINLKIFSISGNDVYVSTIIVAFIIYISIQLTLASLFNPFYSKTKNKTFGKLGIKIGSLITSALLITLLPKDLSYSWVGAAVAFGWFTHIVGDMLTVSGVPVLFPLKVKGKRWWNFRFPFAIKAGGFIENTILVPMFSIIIIISLINIIPIFK